MLQEEENRDKRESKLGGFLARIEGGQVCLCFVEAFGMQSIEDGEVS